MLADRTPNKRVVNVFVGARINISETLERPLRMIVKVEREKRWLEENRAAIESLNSFIDQHGLLAIRVRYRGSA